METKSPTTSVKSREIIGVEQFSQRREVFDKHDTVFLPLPSPTSVAPVYKEVDPIITTNHGITTSNFKRNSPGYSSMRESRNEDRHYEYRPRKYSDNFTSELNQSDDVDYRHTMIERSRRLSKLRREFLNSNIHSPSESQFARTGTRASMPTGKVAAIQYKLENLNIHKFPFAEPYSTPTPARRVVVDLGSPNDDSGKENNNDEVKKRHESLPHDNLGSPKVDHQKLFEDLVKRYSPQRKPIDWTLPPTRPQVVGSVPKSSATISVDSTEQKDQKESNIKLEDDVFEKKGDDILDNTDNKITKDNQVQDISPKVEILSNGPSITENDSNREIIANKVEENEKTVHSKGSLSELEENDYVPELSTLNRQLSKESNKQEPVDKIVDLTIPDLIKKMTAEGELTDVHQRNGQKVKRKRSFLDKLLGRNKGVKTEK